QRLAAGGRGSTTTFVQRGIGELLISWENEAFLALDELGPDALGIVVPSVSILAEPPVAVVRDNAARKGNTDLAEAYLDYLYSAEGQTIVARHHYRPSRPELVPAAELARLPGIETFTIGELFGSWDAVQEKHFSEGGIFDQIYLR